MAKDVGLNVALSHATWPADRLVSQAVKCIDPPCVPPLSPQLPDVCWFSAVPAQSLLEPIQPHWFCA